MKASYPEGMRWTNDDLYRWNGGIWAGGYGCAGFAFILSDTAFGDLPAHAFEDFTYEELRVGDILRVNNDSHSVVILQKYASYVVITEGNWNSKIHWGRTLTKSQVMAADYVITRYQDRHEYEYQHVEPNCYYAGYDLYQCAYCDEYYTCNEVPRLEHHWVLANELAPTEYMDGFISYYCENCGMYDYIGYPPLGECVKPFWDVRKDAYYADGVAWAVEKEVTKGTSSTMFSPDESCTRAQMVTFLWRAAGRPEPSGTSNPFKDVNSSAYYATAVLWAVEKGITNGTSSDTFSPDQAVTREQVVTFLWRYAGSNAASAESPFTDVEPGAYSYHAILWAVENEITQGTSDTTFAPKEPCTRGQIVTFLYRYFG